MDRYLHRILGLYTTRAEADRVGEALLRRGVPAAKIHILEPGHSAGSPERKADSDDVLKAMLTDGAIGTGIGALAGAAGTLAIGLASISLFIASPVVATLVMLGWGGSLGGVVGALVGAQGSKGDVSDLVKDALASGHVVLVVHTDTEAQTTLVQEIVGPSVADSDIQAQPARAA
jgi:hypothetical protein